MSGAAVAEMIAGLVRNPFEVVKQQMQVGWNPTFKSTAREIYNLNGFRGFFAGYFSLILREIPFSMIQFPIYEYIKKRALRNKKELSLLDNVVGGFFAGGTGSKIILL
jgi:solute carrier family 25 S-adenosylmethionine transporter 26